MNLERNHGKVYHLSLSWHLIFYQQFHLLLWKIFGGFLDYVQALRYTWWYENPLRKHVFETARWALQFYKWLLHDYNCKKSICRYRDVFLPYTKHMIDTLIHSYIHIYTFLKISVYSLSRFFKKMETIDSHSEKKVNCTCWRKSGNGPKEFSGTEQGIGAHLLLARLKTFSWECLFFSTSI